MNIIEMKNNEINGVSGGFTTSTKAGIALGITGFISGVFSGVYGSKVWKDFTTNRMLAYYDEARKVYWQQRVKKEVEENPGREIYPLIV